MSSDANESPAGGLIGASGKSQKHLTLVRRGVVNGVILSAILAIPIYVHDAGAHAAREANTVAMFLQNLADEMGHESGDLDRLPPSEGGQMLKVSYNRAAIQQRSLVIKPSNVTNETAGALPPFRLLDAIQMLDKKDHGFLQAAANGSQKLSNVVETLIAVLPEDSSKPYRFSDAQTRKHIANIAKAFSEKAVNIKNSVSPKSPQTILFFEKSDIENELRIAAEASLVQLEEAVSKLSELTNTASTEHDDAVTQTEIENIAVALEAVATVCRSSRVACVYIAVLDGNGSTKTLSTRFGIGMAAALSDTDAILEICTQMKASKSSDMFSDAISEDVITAVSAFRSSMNSRIEKLPDATAAIAAL